MWVLQNRPDLRGLKQTFTLFPLFTFPNLLQNRPDLRGLKPTSLYSATYHLALQNRPDLRGLKPKKK